MEPTSRLSSNTLQAMKKIYILGALAVAATALFSCNKEQDFNQVEEPKGVPFEFVAGTVDTKTVNADLKTNWAADDQISLFHAVKDAEASTAVYDGAFTASEAGASVTFSGTLAEALDAEKNYDWYAIYPYSAAPQTADAFNYVTIGSAAAGAQVQAGNDSKAHLAGVNYPLWGKNKDVAAATKPAITMKQMASIIEVKVTNKTAVDTKVTKVQFSSSVESNLIGEFRVDLSGEAPAFTGSTTNSVATLDVTGADALAEDEYASFFFAVKPFTATAGSKLTITVTTDKGSQELSNIVPANFNFVAGKIHTLNLNFTNESVSFAEFKYNNATWLTAQSVGSLPDTGAGIELGESVQTVGVISVQTLDLGTTSKIWNDGGNYEMRIYKKDKIHVSASGTNYITKITFGSSTSLSDMSANCGTFDASTKTWTGKSQDVLFTLSETAGTTKIQTIGVSHQDAGSTVKVVTLPENEKSVVYDATSVTFPVKVLNLDEDDLAFASSSEGYSSCTPGDGIVTVNFSANASSTPRDIVVNVTNAAAGFAGTLTVKQDGGPTKINTLTATSTGVTVIGQVTAITTKGFVLTDNTGSIYVNLGSAPSYSIGQSITVSGKTSTYYKGIQFNASGSDATITAGATGSYVYPSPTVYGLAEVTAFNGDSSDRLATYVQFSGVVFKSGSYYNFYVGGTSAQNATLFNAPTSYTSGLATGDYVTVKGYAGVISSGKMGVYVTEVTESDTAPALIFSDISGVPAAGVTDQTITVTPYRIPGAAPVVTYTGCVSAASINAACTTVTYSVSPNNDTTPKTGTIVVTFTVSETSYAYTINVSQNEKVSGTEVTVNIGEYASENDWTNGTRYNSITIDSNVTASVTGTGNSGKYYTTGNEWRHYQNESPTITIDAGTKTITSVTITYNVSNTGVLKHGETNVTSGSPYAVGASSISFTVGNTGTKTNGQVKITAIKVVYN